MPQIGENDYRDGAKERIAGAEMLLQGGQLAEAVYLAGRAVEGMLRALIWKADPDYRLGRKPLEAGHNPRELLAMVGELGLLSWRDDVMWYRIVSVSARWANNMRYVPRRWIESYWRSIGVVTNTCTMKRAAGDFFNVCIKIVTRCEGIYENIDKKYA